MSQDKVPLPVPNVPLDFVPAKAGEVINLGGAKLRVMEDGSNTGKFMFHDFTERFGASPGLLPKLDSSYWVICLR